MLRAHNVEHALWDEVAEDMTSRPKRWLLNRFKSKLESEEIKVLAALDGVVTITRDDAAGLKTPSNASIQGQTARWRSSPLEWTWTALRTPP